MIEKWEWDKPRCHSVYSPIDFEEFRGQFEDMENRQEEIGKLQDRQRREEQDGKL